MARAWFFLVLLNSSSFSATRLSISCFTCPSSSWARSTLFSSCSRVPSASSRAACNSSFSCSKLIQQILDLISKVLVLPLDNVQLLECFLSASLQPEQLGAIVSTLILRGSYLCSDISSLGLPLTKYFVKVLASFLSDESSSMNSLVFHADIIQVSGHSGLGLLSIGHLGGKDIHEFLTLHDLGLELVTSSLQLFHTTHALSLKARLPQLNFRLGLGESLQSIRLPHVLILKLLSQILQISGHHLILCQKRRSVLALSISKSLGVLKLGRNRDLTLVHIGNSSLKLINLARQILVLNLQALLGRLSLIKSTSHFIKPGVGIHNLALNKFASFVQLSLTLNSIFQVTTGITKIQLHTGLVLLRLGLV